MNTYNKLLLDEIQAMANLLARHIDNTNTGIANIDNDTRLRISNCLETAIDTLDTVNMIIKGVLNNDFINK